MIFVAETSRLALSAVFVCSEMTDTFGFEKLRIRAVLADREVDVPEALRVDRAEWDKATAGDSDPQVRALAVESLLGTLTGDDVLVSLVERQLDGTPLGSALKASQPSVAHTVVDVGALLGLGEPDQSAATTHRLALAAKLALDALTTFAGICAGFVDGNRMINLTVANAKLRHRAIGLISELRSVSMTEARRALRRAIEQTDEPMPAAYEAQRVGFEDDEIVEREVRLATDASRVLPTAMILASQPHLSFEKARQMLAGQPIASVAQSRSAPLDAPSKRLFGVVEGAYGPL